MGWRESLRRPDWLNELQGLLILALVVVGAFGVFGVAALLGDGAVQVRLPASAVTGATEHQLRAGAAIEGQQDLLVTVTDPSLVQSLAVAMTELPSYAVVVALLALLLRLVRHARRHDPFTPVTVRRLRVLALVALVGGYLGFLVEALAALHLSSTVLTDGFAATSGLPLHWVLVGFGLFAVAEVVRRGCAMRAELAAVV